MTITSSNTIAQIVHTAHRELCSKLSPKGYNAVPEWDKLNDSEKKNIVDSVVFRSENPAAFNPSWCYKEIENELSNTVIGALFGAIVDGMHDKI
jgi:hypothetical protein